MPHTKHQERMKSNEIKTGRKKPLALRILDDLKTGRNGILLLPTLVLLLAGMQEELPVVARAIALVLACALGIYNVVLQWKNYRAAKKKHPSR